jgi:hypothetical protein
MQKREGEGGRKERKGREGGGERHVHCRSMGFRNGLK